MTSCVKWVLLVLMQVITSLACEGQKERAGKSFHISSPAVAAEDPLTGTHSKASGSGSQMTPRHSASSAQEETHTSWSVFRA